MIKLDKESLDHIEKMYPGMMDTISHYDDAVLPVCVHCQSANTAQVSAGIVGRSIALMSATTKFKLNDQFPGKYYCNACEKYFD